MGFLILRQALDSRGFANGDPPQNPTLACGRSRKRRGRVVACGRHGAIAIVDELRPLYANSDDIRDGKELADTTCAKCHGADGVSTANGVPNLAGQRPSYVYRKLKAYQLGDPHGRRRSPRHEADEILQRRGAREGGRLLREPRSGLAARSAGAGIRRSGRGRQGGGGAVREMPRRERRQSQGGRAKPDRLHPKYLVETMQAYKRATGRSTRKTPT